jgi:hypothetical protein
MASIIFKDVPDRYARAIAETFSLIASGKRGGAIDEQSLKVVLGELHQTKFIHTLAECEFWRDKLRVNPKLEAPWDFGSWVDAFMNAAVELQELNISSGSGELRFEELSWPSGGIEALEELVKVFGGTIVSNSAR